MAKPIKVPNLPKQPKLNRNYVVRNKQGRNVTMRANKVKKESPFWGKMKWKWRVVRNKKAKGA